MQRVEEAYPLKVKMIMEFLNDEKSQDEFDKWADGICLPIEQCKDGADVLLPNQIALHLLLLMRRDGLIRTRVDEKLLYYKYTKGFKDNSFYPIEEELCKE